MLNKRIMSKIKMTSVLLLVALVCACAPAKEAEKKAPAPEATTVPLPGIVADITDIKAPQTGKVLGEQTSFTLLCRTEEGAPVPGTGVDICSGSVCRKMKAGEDGTITFYGMPGESYDVTPAEAPEGYVFVSDRALIADKANMKFEFILKEK